MHYLQSIFRLLPGLSVTGASVRLLLAAVLMGSAGLSQAGIFDKIKEAAEKAVEEVVDSTTEMAKDASTDSEDSTPETQPVDSKQVDNKPVQTPTPKTSFSSAAGAYGQWTGMLADRSTNHALASAGLEMLISEQVNVVRVSQMARRCLGDMAGAGSPGRYEVEFLSGREICGESATIEIAPDGDLEVTWDNAPGLEGKTLRGKAERTYEVHARNHWSSSLSDRKGSDIVGFYPGMSYADAMANWNAQHQDLKREIRWVRDEGTSAAVVLLTPRERPKAGQRQLKEEVSLGFESKSPRELPNVDGSQPTSDPEDLRRADSQLLYIYRHILYADRKGPTLDTLKEALAKKYGPPSVDKKTAFWVMQWSYDRDGNRIADAENSACDHWQRYSEQELRPNYKPAQTARVPYVLAHPDCGLTVKVRMTLFDGAVRELDTILYDQQRLMGDQWFGLKEYNAALLAEQRASVEALEAQQAPDL